MKTIHTSKITDAVSRLCLDANINIRKDILEALKKALRREKRPIARDILKTLIENAEVARKKEIPICQDTGQVMVFVELGSAVRIIGSDIKKAINAGVRNGYKHLRKSIVMEPVHNRQNTQDNTPAVVYFDVNKTNRLKITVSPKGFGSENKSRVSMLEPTAGADAVKNFVIDTVKDAGPDACPPYIIGVGIGGTLDKAVMLSKEALLRPIGRPNKDKRLRRLESELLTAINRLNIGPMGLGGKTTALGVNVLTYPTHIAGLPVAVNLCCHALRSASEVI